MLSRRLLLSGFAACSLILAAGTADAAGLGDDGAVFVQKLGDEAMAGLTDKSIDAGERQARFRTLFIRHFDVAAIGRFTMGRYWRTASEGQRKEFLTLFEDAMVRTYATRFADYAGQQFKVVSGRAEADNLALVVSQLLPAPGTSGQPIKIEWRVLKPAGEMKVVDLIIEGVSMAVNQQQEYAAVIQRGGGEVDALLTALRDKR